MSLTCPACRAGNDTPPTCRRCKADLSLLWAVEAARSAALATADTEARAGRWAAARATAERAHALRAGDDSRRLCAALALIDRDFRAAWSYHA